MRKSFPLLHFVHKSNSKGHLETASKWPLVEAAGAGSGLVVNLSVTRAYDDGKTPLVVGEGSEKRPLSDRSFNRYPKRKRVEAVSIEPVW
jgi:hypothetical protein